MRERIITPELFEQLIDLVENPGEPSEALKKAARRYREQVKKRNEALDEMVRLSEEMGEYNADHERPTNKNQN